MNRSQRKKSRKCLKILENQQMNNLSINKEKKITEVLLFISYYY